MIITIKNTKSDEMIDTELYYDKYGNVLLNYLDKYYFLSIDAFNNLEFIEICNMDNLIDNYEDITFLNIKNTSDTNSLRKKIIDEIEYEDEDDVASCHSFSDDEEEYLTERKMLPENKFYYVDTDYTCTKKEHFNFAKSDKNTIIKMFDKSIDGLANFDTLIIDDTINKIHFSSELNHKNSYRVTITLNGLFILNIIGSKFVEFELLYQDTIVDDKTNIDMIFIKKDLILL
jgi:hypothetical protein